MSITYKDLQGRRENNDCAVVAVSILTDTPYDEAYDLFLRKGRRRNGRSRPWWTKEIIRDLGYTLLDVTGQFDAKTVVTLERQLPAFGRFLIETYGHILAYKAATIQDWTKGRRHRIQRIWQVLPKTS